MSNDYYVYPGNIPRTGVAQPHPIIDNFRAIENAFARLSQLVVDTDFNEVSADKRIDLGNTSGAVTLRAQDASVYTMTLVADVTVTLETTLDTALSSAISVFVHQDATGGRAIDWTPSVRWEGAVQPIAAPAPEAVSVYTFITNDGGLSWYGFQTGVDMRVDSTV